MLINQKSSSNPSVVYLSDYGTFAVAWRGLGNDQLNVAFLTNSGTFSAPWTSPTEITDATPQLAYIGGFKRLFMAWKGTGNTQLSIAELILVQDSNGNLSVGQMVPKVILANPQTDQAPGFDGSGELLLAFKDATTSQVMTMAGAVTKTGLVTNASFSNPKPLPNATTLFSPSVRIVSGGTCVAWTSIGNQNLNATLLASGTAPVSGTAPGSQVYPEKSAAGPSLAYRNVQGSFQLYLCWAGVGNNQINIWAQKDWANPSAVQTLTDTTIGTPSICWSLAGVNTSLALAWGGSNNQDLNFNQLSDPLGPIGPITASKSR